MQTDTAIVYKWHIFDKLQSEEHFYDIYELFMIIYGYF